MLEGGQTGQTSDVSIGRQSRRFWRTHANESIVVKKLNITVSLSESRHQILVRLLRPPVSTTDISTVPPVCADAMATAAAIALKKKTPGRIYGMRILSAVPLVPSALK